MVDYRQLSRFERINVVGTSGSGKTTFARELAALLELPLHEMDRMFWKAGWQAASDDEMFQDVRNVTAEPRWVLDGNYTRTIPEKWKQVQLVIWLDLPFARTVFRVTKRAILRSFTQDEIWPGTGNRESMRKAFFSRDSIILWAISSYRHNRRKYEELSRSPEYSHIHFLRLTSPKMVAACLNGLRMVDRPAQPTELSTPMQEPDRARFND